MLIKKLSLMQENEEKNKARLFVGNGCEVK